MSALLRTIGTWRWRAARSAAPARPARGALGHRLVRAARWVPYGDFGADCPRCSPRSSAANNGDARRRQRWGCCPRSGCASTRRSRGSERSRRSRALRARRRRSSTLCSRRSREVRWTKPSRGARAAARLRGHPSARSAGDFEGTLRDYQREGLAGCVPRAARVRRLPRRRHGPGQDGDGAGLLDGRRAAHRATIGGRRSSSCRDRWCSTGSRRPRRFTPQPARPRPHRRGAHGALRRARRRRPRADDLRHAAPRRARLADVEFDYVVLDEAQAIKNAQTATAKACRLLEARHRLALTGTPVENHLGELCSLFEFLNPGPPRQTALRAAHRQRAGSTASRDAESRFSRAACGRSSFAARRSRSRRSCRRRPSRRSTASSSGRSASSTTSCSRHYRRALLARIGEQGLGRARSRSSRRCCACGRPPATRASSTRSEATTPRRSSTCCCRASRGLGGGAQGARLLAVHELSRHRAHESRRQKCRTSTSTGARAIARPRRAVPGRSGLPAVSHQPEGRRPRPQPDRRRVCVPARSVVEPGGRGAGDRPRAPHRPDAPGFAYRLIARDTVEERVLELQQRKRSLADAILQADGSLIRDLEREDLELLLS